MSNNGIVADQSTERNGHVSAPGGSTVSSPEAHEPGGSNGAPASDAERAFRFTDYRRRQQEDVRDAARRYIANGFAIVPMRWESKRPQQKGWPKLRLTLEQVDQYFPAGDLRQNVGILTGEPSRGLVDIDLDAEEAVRLASAFLPPTRMISGRPSKPRSHWYYRLSGPCPTEKYADPVGEVGGRKMLVELRGDGCQTMAPPSYHPSHEPVEWNENGEPAEVTLEELRPCLAQLALAALLARHWPAEGVRQSFAMALAGGLVREGWDKDTIERFLRAVAEVADDEEANDRANTAGHTCARMEQSQTATGWRTVEQILGEHGPTIVQQARRWASQVVSSSVSPELATNPAGPSRSSSNTSESKTLEVMTLKDCESRELEWFWKPRIPKGALTLLEGDPEKGKSLVAMHMIAVATRGEPFLPGEEPVGPPCDVLYLTAEDDIERTVKPRLEAAGADTSRVHVITSVITSAKESDVRRTFAMPQDLDLLEKEIRQKNVKLVVIDPLAAYLSEKINPNNDVQVRQALTPMAQLAERLRVTFLIIRHLNKDVTKRAMYRGSGSIGIVGAARAAMVVDVHPHDREMRVVYWVKGNLGPKLPPLQFCVKTRPVTVLKADGAEAQQEYPYVEWHGECDLDLDAVNEARQKPRASRREACKECLRKLLREGPVPSTELERRLQAEGHSPKTYQRARAELGVVARQTPHGWVTELSKTPPDPTPAVVSDDVTI